MPAAACLFALISPHQFQLPLRRRSAKVEEIRKNGYVLTPGRYVGAQAQEEDGEPFKHKMQRLTGKLAEQFQESARLEAEIRANLLGLGYEI